MAFRPEELAGTHAWKKAVFTTYALGLSFFESVVLESLIRGGTRESVILADAEGVRAGLSEQGAQRVGRDYEVEPITARHGIFHPKLSVFAADRDCHLVVGSGNLTFNGWGGNLEIAEHLHPSFAADAFDDAAVFFRMLADGGGATAHGARDQCLETADLIEATARGAERNGRVRLLHSLSSPISLSIEELASELGGAVSLSLVSPFWDDGGGVERLCDLLGLDSYFAHVHPAGTVRGSTGSNWPRVPRITPQPVEASSFAADARVLHAKAFEIMCRNGRLLVSGSANATAAALEGGNVEACVARVQRDRSARWLLLPSAVPVPMDPLQSDDSDNNDRPGILRAEVAGDVIKGQVLSPSPRGQARLLHKQMDGFTEIGTLAVEEDGSFGLPLPGFETAALRGGRVVFRIEGADGSAEGFASLAAATGLRRFGGAAAASIMAVLSGTETPEDIRVLMEWTHDNPGLLGRSFAKGWGQDQKGKGPIGKLAVKDLWVSEEDLETNAEKGDSGAARGWERFADALFAALRERRGPVGRDAEPDDDGDNDDETMSARKKAVKPPAKKRGALDTFTELFDLMLPKHVSGTSTMRAFDLTAYICDRLKDEVAPGLAESWLRRLVDAMCVAGVPQDRLADSISAVMALCGSDPDPNATRSTRGRVKRLGANLEIPFEDTGTALPFRAVMGDEGGLETAWTRIGAARTWREQASAYVAALATGVPGEGYSELLNAVPSERDVLSDAFMSEAARRKVVIIGPGTRGCSCNIGLPRIEANKLLAYGVGRAANCCSKVLVWPEDANG